MGSQSPVQSDLFVDPNNTADWCSECGRHHHYSGFIYKLKNRRTGQWYVGSHFGCESDGYLGSGVALI